MILGALDKAGGEAYLLRQANENPTAFLVLLGKVLPHQIGGPIDIRATKGSLESAPQVSRLPVRYRSPRPLGSGWAS